MALPVFCEGESVCERENAVIKTWLFQLIIGLLQKILNFVFKDRKMLSDELLWNIIIQPLVDEHAGEIQQLSTV